MTPLDRIGSSAHDEDTVETLPVGPDTCSVNGSRYKANSPVWLGLDFSRAEIRTQSWLMVGMLGSHEASYDLHLNVPFCHPDDQPGGWEDGTYYRVRPLMEPGRKWKGRKVSDVAIKRDDDRNPPWVIEVRYG